jgi:hypothetical protein
VNKYGRDLIDHFLRELVDVTTKDNGEENTIKVPRLFTIRNRAYLQELSQWNPQGNFDRVSANIMLMLLREDRLVSIGKRTEKYTPPEDPMANDKYFKDNYDNRFGGGMHDVVDDYDGLGPSIDFSSLRK